MEFTDTCGVFLPLCLIIGVSLVNGFTDAPTSITSAVSVGAMTMRRAAILSCVFNLLGILLSCLFSFGVANTIVKMGQGVGSGEICASLVAVIIFGAVTYLFGMPSSESIALICALYGSVFYVGGEIRAYELFLTLAFLVISCVMSFLISLVLGYLLKDKRLPHRELLITSLCLSSLIHGSQDGQKFMGLYLIVMGFADTSPSLSQNALGILTVGFAMCTGTLFGGKRIVKALGERTVKLNYALALSSDLGSFASLFVCSLLGVPVSTGNAKATSIMGAGLGVGEKINKKTATELIIASVATIPVCFLLGYFLTFLFT